MAVIEERRLPTVELDNIELKFQLESGASFSVLEMLSLKVRRGEVVAVVGPSGAGKSTILKLVAGLLEPSSGSVLVRGSHQNKSRGTCGYVPQGYSLFPWLTVAENIVYGLRFSRHSASMSDTAVELLRATGLTSFKNAFPKVLSGGMKQRVAVARALAVSPDVLLLDEPFSALDFETRFGIRDYLLNVVEGSAITTLIVTHDVQEAVYMADRVISLTHRPARIVSETHVPFCRPRSRELWLETDFMRLVQAIVSSTASDELLIQT